MLDFTKFYSVPETFEAEGFVPAVSGAKGIFLNGPEYKGKPTRIFAWYSLPEGASPDAKVPGIVLVHGGLGTAYSYWAKMWNDRGFAAIVPDIFCGCPDKTSPEGAKLEKTVASHEFSGPLQKTWLEGVNEKEEDQWPYHATAAIVTAHSFLRSMPEVDADKTGITGISWGGYAVSLAIAYDSRFKFAAPVYGCGNFLNNLKLVPGSASSAKLKKFAAAWDPVNTLSRVKMPVRWLSGTQDANFDVYNWNDTASKCMNSYRSLRVAFPHGQYPGSEAPELLPFARAILEERQYVVFSKVYLDDSGERIGSKLSAPVNVVKAKVVATRSYGCWNDCLFREYEAKYNSDNGTIAGVLPEEWAAAYLLIEDDKGCVYTSEVLFNEFE